MTNKKTNVISAVFFLLMLLCNVGLVVYCIIVANSNGGKLNIDMTEPSTLRSIIYLAAVLMIMIFMFSRAYPAAVFFSLIAGGIMLFNGIKGFIDFNSVKNYLSFGNIPGLGDAKFFYISILLYPTLAGLAYVLMGISIAVNTKKQSNTGLGVVTVITSLLSIIPISYYFIRVVVELIKLVKLEPDSGEAVTILTVIYICMLLIFIFSALGIMFGASCFTFKARTRNNYTPYSELDLSNPYAAPGASTSGSYSDAGNNTFGAGGTIGGQTFYQPYADSDNSTDSSYQTYGTSTAADNVSGMKAKETYANSNAVVNEVNFTATEDTYVEHEFGTPDTPKQTEELHSSTENVPPVSRIIVDDGARFDESQTTEFSVADEIQKFRNLADNGIISEVEFEEKKRQLLNN